MDSNSNIELFGQKIPANAWTLGIAIVVGLTLLGFHGLTLEYGREGATTEIHGGPYVYQVVGSKNISKPVRQKLLIFWTASKLTKLDIPKGEKLEPWYDVDDEEKKIEDFEKLLISKGAQGYNRLDVYGKGTTKEKRGYLWRVTTGTDNENYNRDNFVKFYSEFWGRKKNIYVEEYNFSDVTR